MDSKSLAIDSIFLTSGFEQVRFDEFDAVTMNSNCARAFQWLGCKPKK
jgi:hypothetical protein